MWPRPSSSAGVYKDLLQRPADARGSQYWTKRIADGVSDRQIVQQIEQSPEARQVEVRGLYTGLLGRKADPGGVAYFASQLQAGAALATVEADILSSTEYLHSRGDHTAADLLSSAFRDLLGTQHRAQRPRLLWPGHGQRRQLGDGR